jgi:transcription initiation factor IIE alpha subunit
MQEQFIPCPVCQTQIPFSARALLQGVSFSCPKCFASVSIAHESMDTVQQAMKEFESLKKNMNAKKS